MTDRRMIRPSFVTAGIDAATNELVVSAHTWNLDTKDLDTVELRVAGLDAVKLGGQIALQTSYLARNLVQHALVGHCDTCRNTRRVDVPRKNGNGVERVRCPDCGGRYEDPPPIPAVRDPKEEA